MEAAPQPVVEGTRPFVWLREFLKEELAPHPGRTALVARMVISATLLMLITMTFHLPFGMQGAIFTLVISRESPRATAKAVRTILIAFGFAAVYACLGAMFSLDDPMLRFLWIIASLFIAFYAIRTLTDYVAATGFGIVIAITLPVWDMHIPAELKVECTLWAFGQTAMACAITLLVELAFAALRPRDDLVRLIAERLVAVEELLKSYAAGHFGDERTKNGVTRLGMAGTSRLRRLLVRSTWPLHYREQMGALVALVGRLLDIAANLTYLDPPENAQTRMRRVAEIIAGIRADLLSGRVPHSVEFNGNSEASPAVPLLSEMERTVSLLPGAFTGSRSLRADAQLPSGDPRSKLFVAGALSNPDHVTFALKGCLAASLCYLIYTSVDWPGISTAVVTCVLTDSHYHRLIASEAGSENHWRSCGRRRHWNGSASVHSALSRLNRRVHRPFRDGHYPGGLVRDLQPAPLLFRDPARRGVLHCQHAGIRNRDIADISQRSRSRHSARPRDDVARV